MKAVILAGGFGTRLGEDTVHRPKPMVEIGGRPILWHIMKIYSKAGINDFVICLGYKGNVIKEYFANYFLYTSDVTFDLSDNSVTTHRNTAEPWRVTLVDTGQNTQTGGRLRRVRDYLGMEPFCFTYGDAVTDLDVGRVVDFHHRHGRIATVTAVKPIGRFGNLEMGDEGGQVTRFEEKPAGDGTWINGGFFVLSPTVFDYIAGDETLWEREPMARLLAENELHAYRHGGFWHCMDTPRDRTVLDEMCAGGTPVWL